MASMLLYFTSHGHSRDEKWDTSCTHISAAVIALSLSLSGSKDCWRLRLCDGFPARVPGPSTLLPESSLHQRGKGFPEVAQGKDGSAIPVSVRQDGHGEAGLEGGVQGALGQDPGNIPKRSKAWVIALRTYIGL